MQGLFKRTLLTPGHQLASVTSFALVGSLLGRSLQWAAATQAGHSVIPVNLTCHLCASLASHASACHRLGWWLISARRAGWVPWPASASSHSTLSSSPGRSCQSGSSCSRHLPGAVTAGGNASQVLRLSTNSTVFVESMQKASFADVFILDGFFFVNSFSDYC